MTPSDSSQGASLTIAAGTPRLERRSLKDQIADAIHTEIFTGRMAPGKTYKMGELAAQFGASRTPMRDAMLELESKGFVKITQGVGFTVVAPTPEELRDILEVRKMLEVPAMAAIAGKLDQESLSTARALLEKVGKAAEEANLGEYVISDRDFHRYLLSHNPNQKLAEIVCDLRDASRAPRLVRLAQEDKLKTRHKEHVELLAAIEEGDADRVAEIIERHMEFTRQGIEAAEG